MAILINNENIYQSQPELQPVFDQCEKILFCSPKSYHKKQFLHARMSFEKTFASLLNKSYSK